MSAFDRLSAALQRFGTQTASDPTVYPDVFTSPSLRGRLEQGESQDTATSGEYMQQINPEPQLKLFLPPGVQLEFGDLLTHSDGRRFEVTHPIHRDDLVGWMVGLHWRGGGEL